MLQAATLRARGPREHPQPTMPEEPNVPLETPGLAG
jgi:hypothetical protein